MSDQSPTANKTKAEAIVAEAAAKVRLDPEQTAMLAAAIEQDLETASQNVADNARRLEKIEAQVRVLSERVMEKAETQVRMLSEAVIVRARPSDAVDAAIQAAKRPNLAPNVPKA